MSRQWSKLVAQMLLFFYEYYLRLLCLIDVIFDLNLYFKHFGMIDIKFKRGRGLNVTTNLHVVLKIRKNGYIRPLTHMLS